jgi:sirohydrochlorin ferrochelatase
MPLLKRSSLLFGFSPIRQGVSMKTAVIILGHGSRGNGSDAALKHIVAAIRESVSNNIVEYAYLQYVQPTPEEALDRCVQQGANKILIVPYFMQAGVHVTKDIPALLEKARQKHPTLDIRVTDYVGAHPLMEQIVADLIRKSR